MNTVMQAQNPFLVEKIAENFVKKITLEFIFGVGFYSDSRFEKP